MASLLRSSKFVRHFVSLTRNIVISNQQEVDGSLLKKSQNLVGVFPRFFSSSVVNLQQGSPSLERTVRRLDEDARRTGRISMKEVEDALNEIRNIRKASASQSLMVIRCCGNLVPEEVPERRTQLVNKIWNTLEKLGISLDVSHYNALLKVYLENEHKFSPTEFLAKLEKKGIEPNRVTYQRLIAGYCQMGDIAGATKILEFMKEKQLPVSEGVFNALILGHSQADDMVSAEGILSVMKQASLEPSNETYTTLMCAYAQRGDKEAVDRLIKDCKLKDVLISDRDFLEVAYAAACNDHNQLVDEALNNVRHMIGYNQDAVNVLLRLMTKGKDEAAYKIFMTMQSTVKATENTPNTSGHILIKQLIKTNRPVEDIVTLSEKLARDGHTKLGLHIAVEVCFHLGKVDQTMGLLRVLKERGEPIRQHYFWPALMTAGKAGDFKRMDGVLKLMVEEFETPPNSDTLKEYYLPFVASKSSDVNLRHLLEVGVRRAQSVKAIVSHLISENKLKEAVDLALQNAGINLRAVFMNKLLVDALQQTGDVQSVVSLLHIVSSRPHQGAAADREVAEEDEEVMAVEEIPGRFLNTVVAYAQTRNKIADVLKAMVEKGLSISSGCAEAVESRLQGNELTPEISDLLVKLSSGDLTPAAIERTAASSSGTGPVRNPMVLERIKERIIANNESEENLHAITRSLFNAYCFNDDLENALRVKKEWVEDLKQELTPGWWAQLLSVYCNKEDLKGVEECLEQIKKGGEFELDASKVARVAKLYIQNNQLNEAMQLLISAKPREGNSFQLRSACFQALTAVADTTKDPEQVKNMFKTLLDRKYIEVSNVFLGPVIKAYLSRDDIEGALKEFEFCVKTYRATPWKNEITTRLIEKEDAVNLQTLVDLSTQVHGEINSLYDLVLSFVECGRIRQARKILETPGLRSRNERLQSACERYKNEGLATPLEGLVEATKDLSHIDRSDIYYNLLETYCQTDNADKALGLWTQMQDEDVNISDEFLVKLGNFLNSKGHSVPFTIPKLSVTRAEPEEKKPEPVKRVATATAGSISPGLTAAINSKDVVKALEIKDSLLSSGKELTRGELTRLMELLIENEMFKEAANLFTSSPSRLPLMRTVNYLVTRLSVAGELDLLKHVGDHFSEDLKRQTSFMNRYISCAVLAGKGKEELEKLEKQIDDASTPEEIDTLSQSFPRGGIFAVLNSSPTYLEPVTRIADKYFKKGVSAPANCLCMFHLAEGQFDQAREMYKQYNLANSSRIMFQNVLSKARTAEDPKLVEELVTLLKDAPSITPEVTGHIYSNLVNLYTRKGEFETALTKLEEGLKSSSLENFHNGALVRLKEGLEAKNIPFKYTIPSKQKTKASSTSSTSSSSSDEEPKKSMAAKH